MLELIEALRPHVKFEEEGPPPGEGKLSGLTFVLTGTLPELTREEATQRLDRRGRQGDDVGLEEDGLRGGGRVAGSKLEKAERLGVPVLDEAGLLTLLRDGPPPA